MCHQKSTIQKCRADACATRTMHLSEHRKAYSTGLRDKKEETLEQSQTTRKQNTKTNYLVKH